MTVDATPLPYPWGAGPSLWRPFANVDLWERALSAQGAKATREQCKHVLKKFRLTTSPSLNARLIAEKLPVLLMSVRLRDEVLKIAFHDRGEKLNLTIETGLARAVCKAVATPDEIGSEHSALFLYRKGLPYLDVNKLPYALAAIQKPESLKSFAQRCGAFAMLQPEDAARIFDALASAPGLEGFVLEREQTIEDAHRGEDEAPRSPEKRQGNMKASVVRHDKPLEVPTSAADALDRACASFADHWRSESIARVKRSVTGLKTLSESMTKALDDLDYLQKSIKTRAQRINGLRLFDQPTSPSDDLFDDNARYDAHLRLVQAADLEYSSLEMAADRAQALATRLAESPRFATHSTSIGALEGRLAAYGAAAEAKLRRMSERHTVGTRAIELVLSRRATTEPVISETDARSWLGLLDVSLEATPASLETGLQGITGRWDLGGVFLSLALAAQCDPHELDELLTLAHRNQGGALAPARWVALLTNLTMAQMQELGRQSPGSAQHIAGAFLTSALINGRHEHLHYLASLLDRDLLGVTLPFYEKIVSCERAGMVSALDSLRASRASSFQVRAERDTHRLQDLAESNPGMTGNYHKLRVIARDQFCLPTYRLAASGEWPAALRCWEEFGDDESKARRCEQLLQERHPEEFGPTHRSQTLKYIRQFDRELRATLAEGPAPTRQAVVIRELQDLVSSLRKSQAPGALALLTVLDWISSGTAGAPADFGERCVLDADSRVKLENVESVKPTATRSWTRLVRGAPISLAHHAEDSIVEALHPLRADEAAEFYLRARDYVAAEQAVEVAPESLAFVQEAVRETFAPIVAEVERLESQGDEDDEELRMWLQESREACTARDFDRARDNLEGARKRNEQLLSEEPAKVTAVEFLQDAGLELTGTLAELQKRMRDYSEHAQPRRRHLLPLKRLGNVGVSQVEEAALRSLADELDRPGHWPGSAEFSEFLGIAFTDYEKFLSGRVRWIADERTKRFLSALLKWVYDETRRHLAPGARQDLEIPLIKLADAIASHVPDDHIARAIGDRIAEDPIPASLSRPASTQTPHVRARVDPAASSRELRDEVIAALRANIIVDAAPVSGSERELQEAFAKAVRVGNWRQARELSAARLRGAERPPGRLLPLEAVHLIARFLEIDPSEVSLFAAAAHDATVAGLIGRDASAWLRDMLAQIPERALIGVALQNGVSLSSATDRAARLAQAFEVLNSQGASSHVFEWLSKVLRSAQTLSSPEESEWLPGVVALRFWEALAQKNSAVPRSHLLYALYLMRMFDALRYVARSIKGVDQLLLTCVNAVSRMEDAAVRDRLPQLKDSIAQQTSSPGAAPWGHLMRRIDPSESERVGEAVEIFLDVESSEIASDVSLSLRLVPHSPVPVSLHLDLGGDAAQSYRKTLEEEGLLKEKTFTVRVPRSVLASSLPRVPYRLTGRTSDDGAIDIRGVWELADVTPLAARALSDNEINDFWHGYTGNPVKGVSFHGRHNEIDQIKRLLDDPVRSRSLMLMGQRRIGKTSVLQQLMERYPPKEGGLVAAFADVSGVYHQPGQMAAGLFKTIVSELDGKPQNAALRSELGRVGINRTTFDHLARRAEGESLSSRLEVFVSAVAEATKGRISRIVFLLDEFDRYVGSILEGGEAAAEARALMWQVRQVIQHQERVVFVLAGSGLQRILNRDPEQALFGSIQEVHLDVFDFDADRKAILETLLPERARSLLVRSGNADTIARKAHEVTGGHPYFVSMLGYSAAVLAQGRVWTPATIERTIDAMLSKQVKEGSVINPEKFYGSIFEALARLEIRDRAAAKILLANIALRTTRDYPRLSIDEAIDHPDVRSLTEAKRMEILRSLRDVAAVLLDSSSVRIRIPLTAAALRHDAQELIHDGAVHLRSA